MRSLHALLSHVIDYAGLFPPASLDMATAVQNYAEYRKSEQAWALGRMIVPVSRLEEFEAAAAPLLPHGEKNPWRLSTLGGADAAMEIPTVKFFNQRHNASNAGKAVVETIEAKASTVAEIETLAKSVGGDFQLYIEIPINADPRELIDVIKRVGARAKVRTGGMTGETFPSTADLARFLISCASLNVGFKATAGLHHPLRATYRLTYEPESPVGTMYGFLNVVLAATLARRGANVEVIIQLLEEQDHRSFVFEDDGIDWKKYHIDADELDNARNGFAASFGSCSFTEPIEDLKSLGLL